MMHFTKKFVNELSSAGAKITQAPDGGIPEVSVDFGTPAYHTALRLFGDDDPLVLPTMNGATGVIPPVALHGASILEGRRILDSFKVHTKGSIEALGGTFAAPILPAPLAGNAQFNDASVALWNAAVRLGNPGINGVIDNLGGGTFVLTLSIIYAGQVLNINIFKA